MFKYVVFASLLAISTGQVLKISNAIVGSNQAGAEQIIQLSGGGVGGGGGRIGGGRSGAILLSPPSASASLSNLGSARAAAPLSIGSGRSNIVLLLTPPSALRAPVAPRAPAAAPIVLSAPSAPRVALVSSAPSRVSSSSSDDDDKASPYSFSWESEDENKTKQARQEQSDGQGTITGQYSVEYDGFTRIVKYVADDSGFHAVVETDEPGTLTSNPADVEIKSNTKQ